MKHIFLFVDGLGLAPQGEDNPVSPENCPAICSLIRDRSVPIDAVLGVDGGPPQSATGQATLFTGRNAALFMGRHVTGFPGPTLRSFVEEDNVFLAVKRAGKRARFANGYLADSVEEIRSRRFRSVTTTAALTVPESVFLREDIISNRAVLHDITRASMTAKGYNGPVISPKEAADHLVQTALGGDYTLFEYFLTDQAGHSRSYGVAAGVLKTLDVFVSEVFSLALEMGFSVVLTSDHGNIESVSQKGHTFNKVPLIAAGKGADEILASSASLCDVTPAILKALL